VRGWFEMQTRVFEMVRVESQPARAQAEGRALSLG